MEASHLMKDRPNSGQENPFQNEMRMQISFFSIRNTYSVTRFSNLGQNPFTNHMEVTI